MTEPIDILRSYFHLDEFRSYQVPIINDILGNSDVMVVLPTGAGKSLCYQLPSLMSEGVTIVVSPIISLINDQVIRLKSLGIKCGAVHSQVDRTELGATLTDLIQTRPESKIVYTTPETICGNSILIARLQNMYTNGLLTRFIIDEAHCVSQWGHDFRDAYLNLKSLRQNYPNVPLVSLTATATLLVQNDVIKQLQLHSPKIHRHSFVRDNLHYQIINYDSKAGLGSVDHQIGQLLRTKYSKMSGLIYCLSRKSCEDLALYLRKLGLLVEHFHAGMSTEDKNRVQSDWIHDRVHVIVATIAFGLGIDKPNVRFIIHQSMPKSIEGYYQETGRAGRDHLDSDCILYYNYSDVVKLQWMAKQSNDRQTAFNLISHMQNYCQNQYDCRKQQLSMYLGEYVRIRCGKCDNCLVPYRGLQLGIELSDNFAPIQALLKQHLTEYNIYKCMGQLLPLSPIDIRRLLGNLIIDGFLAVDPQSLQYQVLKTPAWTQKYQFVLIKNIITPETPVAPFARKPSTRRPTRPPTRREKPAVTYHDSDSEEDNSVQMSKCLI